MPRTLILEPSGELWGSERVLLDFLWAASRSAWTIGVCCPPATPLVGKLAELSIPTFPTFTANLHRMDRRRRLLAALRLAVSARRFRADILYANQAGVTRIALLVGRLLRLPVVVHARLLEDADYLLSLRGVLPARIICVSDAVYNSFAGAGREFQDRLTVMYDPYRPRCDWAAPLPGPSRDSPYFSCVGRLTAIKGQDILLHALSRLQDRGIDATAIFAGAAPPGETFGQELLALAGRLGVSGRATWPGFQDDPLPAVAESIALICPSHREPLGRVLFEAWDAGSIPVAWSGSGGPAEVITASGGGLLYHEQSGESLASCLETALEMSVDERRNMVERGRAWLAANCDPGVYVECMLRLWHEVSRRE